MISDGDFQRVRDLVRSFSGIHLGPVKKQLVVSRLAKRLRTLGIDDYGAYCDACLADEEERRYMINTITTNETSFFREPHHFEFMREAILPEVRSGFRVWSAAASIGAEGYSIAMLLDEVFAGRGVEWDVVGTDINTEVIEKASEGLYPMRFTEQISMSYLKKYCLRGIGPQEGNFLIKEPLKRKVDFMQANLMEPFSTDIGRFDVIFLRNILIYFDDENRKTMVSNVLERLKPGGYLFIGHSETLGNTFLSLQKVKPTVYRKKES